MPLTDPKDFYRPGESRTQFHRPKGGSDPVYITGKCKWARTTLPDPTYEKWSIAVYPIAEDLPKLHKLISEGIRNQLKKDDDGYYMNFSRPIRIKLKTGNVMPMEAPKIIDKDGVIFTDIIGDGSDVTVKLETYGGAGPGGKGSYKAARLGAVRINHLVPYTKTSLSEYGQKQIGDLDKQPEQPF
jgi:hypothetical protein